MKKAAPKFMVTIPFLGTHFDPYPYHPISVLLKVHRSNVLLNIRSLLVVFYPQCLPYSDP